MSVFANGKIEGYQRLSPWRNRELYLVHNQTSKDVRQEHYQTVRGQ